MKRYFSAILMVVLLLTCFSCHGNDNNQDIQTAESSNTSTETVVHTASTMPEELPTEDTESVSYAYLDTSDYGPIGTYAHHIAIEITNKAATEGLPHITQLEHMPAASVGLNSAYYLYRMKFDVIDDHNTVLYRDDIYFRMSVLYENDTELWRQGGYITADEMEKSYNTPEMLEQYGDKYTAAAMCIGYSADDTEQILPEDCTVHTEAFHTISDSLIDLVGDDAYKEFRDRYAGTEEFNVLNFLSFFYLDIENVRDAINKDGTYPSPYTVADLHGDVQTHRDVFLLPEYRETDVRLYYGLPTLAECQEIVGWNDTELQQGLCAFLRNDFARFAMLCGVKSEVYAHMENMKISEYTLTRQQLAAVDDPNVVNPYPVLTFTVTESQSDVFPVGEHTLVWYNGLFLTFTFMEDFQYFVANTTPMSMAEKYLLDVYSDRGFESILKEGKRQEGLCDFIIARLDAIHGNHDPRTAEEIGDYAEKYLGVDRSTLNFENKVDKTPDGRYVRIGRGRPYHIYTLQSEEIRDGITIVTLQFFADASQTVPSRKVEYHMELVDGEYKPVEAVILEDSPFDTEYYST